MKKCLYCAEEIQDEAIKCRYCGEMLEKQGVLKVIEKLSKESKKFLKEKKVKEKTANLVDKGKKYMEDKKVKEKVQELAEKTKKYLEEKNIPEKIGKGIDKSVEYIKEQNIPDKYEKAKIATAQFVKKHKVPEKIEKAKKTSKNFIKQQELSRKFDNIQWQLFLKNLKHLLFMFGTLFMFAPGSPGSPLFYDYGYIFSERSSLSLSFLLLVRAGETIGYILGIVLLIFPFVTIFVKGGRTEGFFKGFCMKGFIVSLYIGTFLILSTHYYMNFMK